MQCVRYAFYSVGTRWAGHRNQFASHRQVCIWVVKQFFILLFSIQGTICLVLLMTKYVGLILTRNVVISIFNVLCLVLGIFGYQDWSGDKQSQ